MEIRKVLATILDKRSRQLVKEYFSDKSGMMFLISSYKHAVDTH